MRFRIAVREFGNTERNKIGIPRGEGGGGVGRGKGCDHEKINIANHHVMRVASMAQWELTDCREIFTGLPVWQTQSRLRLVCLFYYRVASMANPVEVCV